MNNEVATGGHTRYLELLAGMAAKGHEVTAFMNSFLDRTVPGAATRKIPVRYVKGKTRFVGELFKRRILEETRGERITADYIVIFGETHWPAAKALSRKYRIPVLYALRSDSIEESRSYLRLESPRGLRRLSLSVNIAFNAIREADITNRAALIAFQSPHDRDRFVARNPRSAAKTTVIRGDIRQARFKGEFRNVNRASSCRKLLFVGTLGKRKGLAYLIRAIGALPGNERDAVTLDVLAAGTDYATFEGIAKESGVEDRVVIHGKVSNPLEYMRDADILVVPSIFDSYPNVVLEALHVGLPVIGSRVGGIPDMLDSEQLLFDPASVDSLSKSLSTLVGSDERYREARELCARRRDYFDFDWADEWIAAMNRKITEA